MTAQTTTIPDGRYLMAARVDIGSDVIYPHDTAGMLNGSWWRARGATFVPEAYIEPTLAALEETIANEAVEQAILVGGPEAVDGGVELTLGTPAGTLLEFAALMAEYIGDAPNYRENGFTMEPRLAGEARPQFVFTVQRYTGKSPAQLRNEAEDRAAALTSSIHALTGELRVLVEAYASAVDEHRSAHAATVRARYNRDTGQLDTALAAQEQAHAHERAALRALRDAIIAAVPA